MSWVWISISDVSKRESKPREGKDAVRLGQGGRGGWDESGWEGPLTVMDGQIAVIVRCVAVWARWKAGVIIVGRIRGKGGTGELEGGELHSNLFKLGRRRSQSPTPLSRTGSCTQAHGFIPPMGQISSEQCQVPF